MKKRSLIAAARQIASRVKCDETLADLNIDSSPLFLKKIEEANKDLKGAKLPEGNAQKSVRTVS
jgi:hypothetical protein